MVKYVEQLKKVEEELKEIKQEVKLSSFDTIYTSIIIFGASIIFSYILIGKFNFWVGFLGVGIFGAIILQFVSIFKKDLKKVSIWFLWGVILYAGLIYSYTLFPLREPDIWNIKNILSIRNIISAIILFVLYFGVMIPTSQYFKK